jgi:hypothetical protein
MYSMTLAAAVVPLAWRSPRARYPVLAASMLYVLAGWCAGVAWTAGLRLLWVAVAPPSGQASGPGNDLDLHPLAGADDS